MTEFISIPLLITEYYDSLISQLDIHAEERIKEIRENGLTKIKPTTIGTTRHEPYGIEEIINPYESQKYTIDRTDVLEIEITEISQAEEYINRMRQKAIDEIRKIKEANFKYYKANKEKFKVDRKNLTEEKLEELKSQLFACNRFCFLVYKRPCLYYWLKDAKPDKYIPLFNLHTVITDFYLRKSDIEFIRSQVDVLHQMKHSLSTKLDQRFLLANQVQKYLNEMLDVDLNGYEVIQINQKTLFDIEHIEVQSTSYLTFSETNLSSFDIYLSPIKSLNILTNRAMISDMSAFANLEFLSISGVKLSQWPFKGLHKLIKLKIFKCDLSEFDFDSLDSLTSLQIIDIDMNNDYNIAIESVSFKIDLNEFINLKWLDLRFIKGNDEGKHFELVKQSSNHFSAIELKCLRISNVDLSQQINKQFFYGMTSLIDLKLINLNLKNVDFLDTDELSNLEFLYLNSNQITVLRKGAFSKVKKLKFLILCDNLIEEFVPGVFEGLKCLELLAISSNRFNVKSIDKKVFNGLNCLKNLSIRNYETRFVNIDHLKRDGLDVS